MPFTLDEVVPWGRSFEEYRGMFNLTREDLELNVLGCSDGPASFNALLTKRGGRVVSVDPLYRFSREEIMGRIAQVFDRVLEETRKNAHEFVWKTMGSVEALGQVRQAAMNEFLEDYPKGSLENRYVEAELPALPFEKGEFGLALCSHFLFLYSQHLSLEFHLQSIRELCRIAEEVRIFPLLELGAVRSRHLDFVKKQIEEEGYHISVDSVPYEFQRGGNQMMRIRRS
ncbi:MAG: hypothetical protein ACYCTV_01380 [Leptospirales bacterium]